MRPFLALQTLCKRVRILFESLNTQSLINLLRMSYTSSSLTSMAINSNETLLEQLDSVYIAVDAKLSAKPDSQLYTNCREIHLRTKDVIKYAKLYDYKDIEANGYWTYVKLIIKCGKVLLNSYDRGTDSEKDFVAVSQILKVGLDLCEKFHNENMGSNPEVDNNDIDSKPKYKPELFASTPEKFVELLEIFKTLQPQLHVIYGTYCSYWLCPSMRRAMQGFTTLMAMYASNISSFGNIWNSSKNIWDRTHRAYTVANIAQNASVEFVKSFWGLTEYRIVKNGLPTFVIRAQPKVVKEVFIPRQIQWQISSTKAEVINTNSKQRPESSESNDTKLNNSLIRCKLLQHLNSSPNEIDSIVLHIHGGGFVSQSPDSHEVYLRDWAIKLDGIPILSVDYSLSPEAKYPIALQEVLDCYLWLISKDPSVKDILGFNPKRIVICGDSAGGNMSLSIGLIINDMRKTFSPAEDLIIPAGIVCFYTPFMLKTIPSPSRLMTAVDTLLPLGVLLACLEAYAPSVTNADDQQLIDCPKPVEKISKSSTESEAESEHEEHDSFDFASLYFLKSGSYDCERVSGSEEDEIESMVTDDNDLGNDFVHITYDDVPPDEDLLFELPNDLSFKWQRKCCHTLRQIKNKIIGPTSPSALDMIPWYRNPNPNLLVAKLKQLNESTSNPYVSPLMPDFDFDDIPLYLIALTYDACLDDSIEMAKKWKGPLVLDILDELPHGFLNFVLLSEEGKRGSDLGIKRIRQAFGLLD